MRYRSLVLLSLLLAFTGIAVFNWLYLVEIKRNARGGHWIEEPLAKSYLATRRAPFDYVFIGTSRTQNHINTQLLGTLGMKALNLGMAGRTWEYYPDIISRVADSQAQTIVISIAVELLYQPVSCPESYFYQINLDLLGPGDLRCFYIDNLKWNTLLQELPMNRFLTALEQVPSESENTAFIASLDTEYGYDRQADTRVINYVRGDTDRFVVTFTNGDGQVFSRRAARRHDIGKRTDDRTRKPFNPEAIRYINQLATLALSHGLAVVYILEPAHAGTIQKIDDATLRDRLPHSVAIINNASRYYERTLWADAAHFNLQGSNLYTRQVFSALQALRPAHSERSGNVHNRGPETRPGKDHGIISFN